MSARSIWSIPVVVLVVLVVLAGVQPAAADPRLGDSKLFDTWTGYPSGRYLEAVVAPDLNGDGKPDVAWARNDFFDNEMNVQLNLGDGTMSASVEYPVTESSTDIKSGDLDSDGDPDLVVISEGTSYTNSVVDLYFNDGGGTFAHTTAAGGYGPRKLVVADLDGDDDPDLALSNYWRNDISVLRNKGDGTFASEARYTVGSEPNGIDAADLDADGDLDLSVVRYDPSTGKVKVHLLTNSGAGVFALVKTIGLAFNTQGPPVVAGTDLDGDGDPDLAVAGGGDQVYVLKNAGGLSFTQQVFTGGFSAFDILATDVDLDGDADLLTPTYGSDTGEITLLRNQGAGTFSPPVTIESGRNPHDVAAADFSGEGRPDLAVANRITDTGSIHPQRADGSFAIPPIHATSSELPNALASADFDGDGDVDVAEGDVGLYEAGAVHVMRN
nr:VCBS repeat-containing protein [Actinomycetota bacterium]